jgi:purine-binding chemotaxis protein CheW
MTTGIPDLSRHREDEAQSFVTFRVADHLFGVPVMRVQDILTPHTIAPVPGGPKEVRGLINLRGRIVTVVDMRTRLSLPPRSSDAKTGGMCVTVERDGEYYTLFVDTIGDVVTLSSTLREPNPSTLDQVWKAVAEAVYRTEEGLLIALDIDQLLALEPNACSGRQ